MPIRVRRDPDLYNAGWSKPRRSRVPKPAVERPVLSPREIEVLTLLAAGMKRPGIAERLCIARETVRAHCTAIFERLGVHSAAGAVAKALREGLIQ